jgi:hypothetical protein
MFLRPSSGRKTVSLITAAIVLVIMRTSTSQSSVDQQVGRVFLRLLVAVPRPLLKDGLVGSHAISPAAAMTGSPTADTRVAVDAVWVASVRQAAISANVTHCTPVLGEAVSGWTLRLVRIFACCGLFMLPSGVSDA